MILARQQEEIIDAVYDGEDVWVSFDEEAKAGSMGKIHTLNCYTWMGKRRISSMVISFPGLKKRSLSSIMPEQVTWLPDYTGPAVWVVKKKPPKVIVPKPVRDIFQQDISIGDLVVYNSRFGVMFGQVLSLDAKGYCEVEIIPVMDWHRSEVVKVMKPEDKLTILNQYLADNLLVAKLTYGGV